MNRSQELRRILASAPTTCDEIATLLNLSPREAWVAVWVLTSRQEAKAAGRIPKADGEKGRGHNLYELTSVGHKALRRVAKNGLTR